MTIEGTGSSQSVQYPPQVTPKQRTGSLDQCLPEAPAQPLAPPPASISPRDGHGVTQRSDHAAADRGDDLEIPTHACGPAAPVAVSTAAKAKIDQGDLGGAAQVVTEQKTAWWERAKHIASLAVDPLQVFNKFESLVKDGKPDEAVKALKAFLDDPDVKLLKLVTDPVVNISVGVGRGLRGTAAEIKASAKEIAGLVSQGKYQAAGKAFQAYFKPLQDLQTSVTRKITEGNPLDAIKQLAGVQKGFGYEDKEFTRVASEALKLYHEGHPDKAAALLNNYTPTLIQHIQQSLLSDRTEDSHITHRVKFSSAGKAGPINKSSTIEQQRAVQAFQQAKAVLGDVNNWKHGVLPPDFDFHVYKGKTSTEDSHKPEKDDYIQITNPPPAPPYWVQVVDIKEEPKDPQPGQKASFSFTVRPSLDPTGKSQSEIAHFYDPSATRTFRVEYNPAGPGGVPEVKVRTDGLRERANVAKATPADALTNYGAAAFLRDSGLQQEVWESLTFSVGQQAAAHGGEFNIDEARADLNPAEVGPAAQTVHDRYVDRAEAFNKSHAGTTPVAVATLVEKPLPHKQA